MLIPGSALTPAQRRAVLAAFVHRHTIENVRTRGVDCVNCANIGRFPYTCGEALPDGPHTYTRAQWHAYHVGHGAIAVSDDRWLADHAFHFVRDGSRLMARRHAEPAFMAETEDRS